MATETILPDGIQSSAQYSTLNLADIDEDPASPDGTFGTWDGNGNTSCVVDFPTPTPTPTTGAGLQTFRVEIRRDGGTGSNSVNWSLELWESGVIVGSALATGTTTSTSEVVSGTWDAASLATSDGSNAQCAMVQTSGGTGGPSARRGLEVGAFAWDVDYTEGGASRRIILAG